jgi:hypothetical protein
MRKFIYIFVLLIISSLSISSCTKEEVKPSWGDNTGGKAIKEL